uniref:Hypothetical chloroplast RF20 n=1 Tax=Pseudochlorella signiensis TaxID=173497 RepID=A0A097KL23_9CHLO|nr:hypothetical chloroplast RF20 [Pseudochlorella signiensis]AIT93868.1 hypothetical chloroplast RF20 [Pseudochlorella signiensis]
MDSNTRIFKKVIQFTNIGKNKLFSAKNNLPIKIFLLFSGFLIGSLFGTFLPSLPEQINSYSVIILITITAIEIVNYLVYSSKKRQFFFGSFFGILLQFFLSIKTKLVSFFFNRDPTLQSYEAQKNNKKVSSELQIQTMVPQFEHGSITPKGEGYQAQLDYPLILHSKEDSSFRVKQWQNTNKNFYKNLNSFKIGIMLGFFIDAFKVGS